MGIQTKILWGRTLSDEERALNRNQLTSLGVEVTVVDPDSEGYRYRDWATKESAEAYLEFANSLVPPPESASIIES